MEVHIPEIEVGIYHWVYRRSHGRDWIDDVMEVTKTLFNKFVVSFGIMLTPSSFLEQLDFIDSPNIRLQIFKFNIYLYGDSLKRFVERNKVKTSLAQYSFTGGYMASKLESLNGKTFISGRA